MNDIEIAHSVRMQPILNIARKLGISEDSLEQYGRYKAKLSLDLTDPEKAEKSALILVSAMTPTPAGEGKTTISIGLNEGLNYIGKRSVVVLREPSLGPVFGVKGGAAGGGYAQVVPMEDINLHFTGDFAAIEKANNFLAAIIDNVIRNRNHPVQIDPRTVVWKRVTDMNDRALREIIIGMGGKSNGFMRTDGFNITAASEIMAILCLSENLEDLKTKLGNILVGFTYDGRPVFARDLQAVEAMAILLRDAIKPNLVQTLEGNPAILHGGPFANIAQGTNSLIATKMGMSLADYTVTEAGFGADLGAEKFMNIKCVKGNLKPSALVIVATIRALRHHGGAGKDELGLPSVSRVKSGFVNLRKHLMNAGEFGMHPLVAVNRFNGDTEDEISLLKELCAEMGVTAVVANAWSDGGKGCAELAEAVVREIETGRSEFRPLYAHSEPIENKISAIAGKIYGADGVDYTPKALSDLEKIKKYGMDGLPVCIAKTQKSFSDREELTGCPSGFRITVREFEIAAGAGFVIPILGSIMRMPGLPAVPASEHMHIDSEGKISGLS